MPYDCIQDLINHHQVEFIQVPGHQDEEAYLLYLVGKWGVPIPLFSRKITTTWSTIGTCRMSGFKPIGRGKELRTCCLSIRLLVGVITRHCVIGAVSVG